MPLFRPLLALALLLSTLAEPARAATLTDCDGRILPETTDVSPEDVLVCTITINSANEEQTFKKHVCGEKAAGKHYRFMEFADPSSGDDAGFSRACDLLNAQRKKRGKGCEVLIISGHFAGKYFFGSSGKTLRMDDLDAASCAQSCPGVLRDPAEAFLFGCNTLAGKTSSADTPAAMRARLTNVDHLSEADVEEIVQGRFGELGESNEDRMRGIFSGVPNVYGYKDIGPLGAGVQGALNNYLAATEAGGKTYKQWLTERQLKPVTNIALMRALAAFPITETCGIPLGSDSPESLARQVDCALGDEHNSVADRLNLLATAVTNEGEFMRYLPSMQKFFDAHSPPYPDPVDQRAFDQLKAKLAPLGAAVAKRVDSDGMKAYPLVRYDLASTAYTLGWGSLMEVKTRLDFEARTAAALLKHGKISGPAEQLVCRKMQDYDNTRVLNAGVSDLSWKDLDLRASDVDASVYGDPSGMIALGCLNPTDPEVLRKVAASIPKLDPHSQLSDMMAAMDMDGRHLLAEDAVNVFKRLLSLTPQPPLDRETLLALSAQIAKADDVARAKALEILTLLTPAPSDPAVLKAVCALKGAKQALTFCAPKP